MGACDEGAAACVSCQLYFGAPRAKNAGDIWPHVGPFGGRCEQQNEMKVSVVYGGLRSGCRVCQKPAVLVYTFRDI